MHVGLLGFHHLDDGGQLHDVAGRTSDLLTQAVAGLATAVPLDAETLAASVSAARVLKTEEKQVTAKLRSSYTVTAAITLVCLMIGGLELAWKQPRMGEVFLAMGANTKLHLGMGEVWRLLASAFLHADALHIALNMAALWSFGPLLESLLGPRRYVVLYGLAALGGSLASALIGPAKISVGASGAIWGLMTAFIAIAYVPRGVLPDGLVRQFRQRALPPLAINLFYSFQPGIDLWAHIGGGVVGFVLVAAILTRGLKPVAERTGNADAEVRGKSLTTGLAAVVGLVMLGSIGVAFAKGHPWELGAPPVLVRTALPGVGLSVDLPTTIAESMIAEKPPGGSLFMFGNLDKAPLAVEIVVIDRGSEIAPGDLEAALSQLHTQSEKENPKDLTRNGPAMRVKLGARPAIRVDYQGPRGILATGLTFFQGRYTLGVIGYYFPSRPASWAIEEKIAASISP
jgi:rhomboid protease GluP